MAVNKSVNENEDIRVHVRERYGRLAEKQSVPMVSSCCGSEAQASSSCCGTEDPAALEKVERMYETNDVNELPEEVTNLSLGCGDPVTLASLEPGQTVLDLGSGGGIDCFLARLYGIHDAHNRVEIGKAFRSLVLHMGILGICGIGRSRRRRC